MSYHEVVYVHDCPAIECKVLLIIQYEHEAHEQTNLKTKAEHFCKRCKVPMKRLGSVPSVRKKGDGEEYLHPEFYLE